MYWVSPSVRIPITGSRVAWALGLTSARCCPTSALRRVDFPTLGEPARAMWPVLGGIDQDRRPAAIGYGDEWIVFRYSSHVSCSKTKPHLPWAGGASENSLLYSMTISTRRFFSRLARLSFGAIGLLRPNP